MLHFTSVLRASIDWAELSGKCSSVLLSHAPSAKGVFNFVVNGPELQSFS